MTTIGLPLLELLRRAMMDHGCNCLYQVPAGRVADDDRVDHPMCVKAIRSRPRPDPLKYSVISFDAELGRPVDGSAVSRLCNPGDRTHA